MDASIPSLNPLLSVSNDDNASAEMDCIFAESSRTDHNPWTPMLVANKDANLNATADNGMESAGV